VVQDKAFAALTDEGDTTRAGDARAIDVVVATMRGHTSSEWVPRFAFMTLRNLPIDEAGNGNVCYRGCRGCDARATSKET
jgi:hypothetical protein